MLIELCREDTCSGVRLRAQDDSSGPLPAPTYRERDAPPRHFCHMDRRRRIYHLGGGSQLATSNCSRSCRCVSSSSGKLPKRLHELTCFFAPDKVVIPSSTPSVILSVSTAISSLDLQGGNLTLAADAVLLADSISVQGALALANGAILSARGVIILTSVYVLLMKSASLSATQSINATVRVNYVCAFVT